ncbi:DUF1553 domain-containing protein [Planctomicrobium sp. SH661]|uniref:DUF1553 domain-containing protein n=1 Tax=Planctomicrobium sp. SH661 TaxID=3448124 RepID=UPI003F5AEC88
MCGTFRRAILTRIYGLILFTVVGRITSAESPTPEEIRFFENKVRPLLAEHCFKCHGAEQQKGGLRLDSRSQMLLGGESGPAIEPGNANNSLLLEAVRYDSFQMPPGGKLPEAQLQILADWITAGAPWPGDEGQIATRVEGKQFTDEDRAWWAFQPVRKPDVPSVQNETWGRNEIDAFIAQGLENQGLTAAPEADRSTLIRRLYFDLIGLPPTPDEVRNFVADEDPYAYERLVDTLLARPEYGERWARHWLDLVRYADSDGYRADHHRPQAWRYRDYVIDSLNDDKPYDRFVQEQLAGDELFPGDPQALIATGFLRHGIYEYNARDVRGQWDVMLNEVTDATSDVFLGLGMQCARCHDHKYDPILQKDYFRLRAFFEPLMPRDDLIAATDAERSTHAEKLRVYEEKTAKIRAELEELESAVRKRGEVAAVSIFPDDIKEMIHKPDSERTPQEKQLVALAWRQVLYEHERLDSRMKGDEKEKILALRRALAAFSKEAPAPLPTPMAATDVGSASSPTVIPKKKLEVQPGFLTLLESEPAEIIPVPVPDSTGRRATLARWLTRPDNPLTTRVVVNRIWQFHFGRGLVENSSDFGRLGAPPSHPELLDWLTVRFVDQGWKFKDLHRLIVTSATYRQSTSHPDFEACQRKDPANIWHWRAPTRRLDAEQIRDAIFAVSGQLNLKRGGPGVQPDQPRRSIYTLYMRNSRDPLLDVFDLPQFFSSSASRDTTTSPVQSLLLINSQTMLRHSSHLSKAVARSLSGNRITQEDRIRQLWRLALGRDPRPDELNAAQQFLLETTEEIGRSSKTAELPNLPTGKMPYRDGQALLLQADGKQGQLLVPAEKCLLDEDFTIEGFFQLRSIFDSGNVRTLAAKVNESSRSGWAFGITGKGSRRKPQTLVLQIYGIDQAGKRNEVPVFSDQHVEINKPYYAAASVRLATGERAGSVTFYLKDLSNDDEPLQVAELPLSIVSGVACDAPIALGSRNANDGYFDGLIDDLRLSRGALHRSQLLYTSEGVIPGTMGYWQFEPAPGIFQDTSSGGLKIHPLKHGALAQSPEEAAFVDLCHVLLNSNEFLYVD